MPLSPVTISKKTESIMTISVELHSFSASYFILHCDKRIYMNLSISCKKSTPSSENCVNSRIK